MQYSDKIKQEQGAASDVQVTLKEYISNILEGKIERKTEKQPYKTDTFDVGNVCGGFFDIREFYYLQESFETEINRCL